MRAIDLDMLAELEADLAGLILKLVGVLLGVEWLVVLVLLLKTGLEGADTLLL